MFSDFFLILILILANGFFAAAEIAVVWLDGDYTVFPIGVFREPEKL